eukprot:263977-Rhodomonas_salina.8
MCRELRYGVAAPRRAGGDDDGQLPTPCQLEPVESVQLLAQTSQLQQPSDRTRPASNPEPDPSDRHDPIWHHTCGVRPFLVGALVSRGTDAGAWIREQCKQGRRARRQGPARRQRADTSQIS